MRLQAYSYALVYEDLLKDKEDETKTFLKAIGVSQDQFGNAMKVIKTLHWLKSPSQQRLSTQGFEGDSQNGMFKGTSGTDPKNQSSIGEKGWEQIRFSFAEMRLEKDVSLEMSLDDYRRLVAL